MARGPKVALKDEVRDALLEILRDKTASAAARASAGRTLLEIDRESAPGDTKAPGEMTVEEIDEEIARKGGKPD